MRGGLTIGLMACCLSAAGCGVQLEGAQPLPDGNKPNNPDARTVDAPTPPPVDGPPALGPWGMPKLVAGAGLTTRAEDDGSLSSSTHEMIFSVADPAANNTKDLWYMSRPSPAGAWSAPVKLPFNITGVSDETPRFSADDLTLYFASARAGGPGGLDIYRVTRPAVGSAWGTPQLVPGVSTAGVDKWFMPCSTGDAYMVIVGNDIGAGTLGSPPTVCAELSPSTSTETGTFLSPDCKTVYFASTRNAGVNKIFRATRPSIGAPFTAPELVTDFDTLGGAQEDPWLSTDLRTFVFVSDKSGTKDVYISTR